MGTEDHAGNRRLADIGEEMPEAENVADFVDEGVDLLLVALREQARIENEVMPSGIGEEGTSKSASTAIVASICGTHADLKVPSFALLLESDRGREDRIDARQMSFVCGLPAPVTPQVNP